VRKVGIVVRRGQERSSHNYAGGEEVKSFVKKKTEGDSFLVRSKGKYMPKRGMLGTRPEQGGKSLRQRIG